MDVEILMLRFEILKLVRKVFSIKNRKQTLKVKSIQKKTVFFYKNKK